MSSFQLLRLVSTAVNYMSQSATPTISTYSSKNCEDQDPSSGEPPRTAELEMEAAHDPEVVPRAVTCVPETKSRVLRYEWVVREVSIFRDFWKDLRL